ncbi:hypothetical protein SAMN04488095_1894 [Jannaschia pohangensis]|uniref:Uncharacterized protein n=2 Tax=Jannaschia pohangensis TaxID=390807 RepID=A0A1I3MLR4_9RHOB|nr:hypothetical protein SAMN04488095_1894 [Jannaschia pohangensis]
MNGAAQPARGIGRYLSDGWDGVAVRLLTWSVICGCIGWFFPVVGGALFAFAALREVSHVAFILRRRTPSARRGGLAIAPTLEARIERLGPVSGPPAPSLVDEGAPIVTGRGILATMAVFSAMGVIWAIGVHRVDVFEAVMQGLSFAMFAPILLGLILGAVWWLVLTIGDPVIEAVFAFGHLGAAAIPHRAWRIRAHDAVDARAEAMVLWATRPRGAPLFPRPAISRRLWLRLAGLSGLCFCAALWLAWPTGAAP